MAKPKSSMVRWHDFAERAEGETQQRRSTAELILNMFRFKSPKDFVNNP
jgi:hypothetical protein